VATVSEVTARYENFLVPILTVRDGVCTVCKKAILPGWNHCYQCNTHRTVLSHTADIVVPVALAVKHEQWAYELSSYKNSSSSAARDSLALRLGVTRRMRGEPVMLIDDQWTSGGHAQSAAAALKLAGSGPVAVVSLGRHFDRRPTREDYREAAEITTARHVPRDGAGARAVCAARLEAWTRSLAAKFYIIGKHQMPIPRRRA
jgi:predicted amidophosphoribosyltransferase